MSVCRDLSAPNRKSQIASDLKSRSPNPAKGGAYRTILGSESYRTIWGIAMIVSECRTMWCDKVRSEKTSLGGLGELKGIHGAALGMQKQILGMQDSSRDSRN